MTKSLNLILVLLLFSSCDDISSSSSEKTDSFLASEKTTDTLHIELEITSEEIKSLKDIKAQFKLKNLSGEEIVYVFPSGCQLGCTVKKHQNTIFDNRENLLCTGALSYLKLEPYQTKNFPISLGRLDVNKKLDKGIYKLNAFLLENHTPKISASFKVK